MDAGCPINAETTLDLRLVCVFHTPDMPVNEVRDDKRSIRRNSDIDRTNQARDERFRDVIGSTEARVTRVDAHHALPLSRAVPESDENAAEQVRWELITCVDCQT